MTCVDGKPAASTAGALGAGQFFPLLRENIMAAVMSQSAPPAAASRLLLSGNEAVARAVWESGVRVAAAYPGTPATEIIESVARYPDLYAEWSVN
jgi:hypothetical protein